MIEMQSRPMHVHVIAKELQVSERTAFRYITMFNELGFKLNRTVYGAYTLKNDNSNPNLNPSVDHRTRPARRIKPNQKAK